GGAGEDDGEVRGLNDRNGDPDEPRPPAGERPSVPVRAEAVLADDAQHCLARLRRDVGAAVDHARDGRDRDAGGPGDLADRRSPVVAVALVPRHLAIQAQEPEPVTARAGRNGVGDRPWRQCSTAAARLGPVPDAVLTLLTSP